MCGMARILDVTLEISGRMMTWPTDPPVEIERAKHLAADGSNVSALRLGTHAGTHVDPPLHFIEGGAPVDRLPLESLVGEAHVVDLREIGGHVIEPAHLEALSLEPGVARVLFRTTNSDLWSAELPAFPSEYVALSVEGARWCVERGLRLVGTDFLSIERRGAKGHPTHITLLDAGVVILEGLDLSAVEPGEYVLACLPLKIAGGDGAPARVVLMEA